MPEYHYAGWIQPMARMDNQAAYTRHDIDFSPNGIPVDIGQRDGWYHHPARIAQSSRRALYAHAQSDELRDTKPG